MVSNGLFETSRSYLLFSLLFYVTKNGTAACQSRRRTASSTNHYPFPKVCSKVYRPVRLPVCSPLRRVVVRLDSRGFYSPVLGRIRVFIRRTVYRPICVLYLLSVRLPIRILVFYLVRGSVCRPGWVESGNCGAEMVAGTSHPAP